MYTILDFLKDSENIQQMLYLKEIIVVMDQALYAKGARSSGSMQTNLVTSYFV